MKALAAAIVIAVLTGLAPPTAGREEREGPGIFVPPARGEGESLDSSPERKEEGKDTVVTVRGDRIVGHVAGIGPTGLLRLTSPCFDGEVHVRVDALDKVRFGGAARADEPDEVRLSNGDRIRGRLLSLTGDSVVIESEATGRISVPRRLTTGVELGAPSSSLLESDFAYDEMDPWVPKSGNWSIREERLTLQSSGSVSVISAPLKHDGPTTMEVDLVTGPTGLQYTSLVLSADDTTSTFGRGCVYGSFQGSRCTVGYVAANGSGRTLGHRSRPVGVGANQAVSLRLAFDPVERDVRMWLNDAVAYEGKVPADMGDGRFVMFAAQQPLAIESIRVYRGMESGGGAEDAEAPEEDGVRIVFVNGDKLSASAVTLVESGFELTTEHGTLVCPPENLSRIVFGKGGVEAPPEQAGDIVVTTNAGRLTLRIGSMDEDRLVGTSAAAGAIEIRRSALRSIRFPDSR